MRVTSLGFRTDVALRVLEGAEVTDRGDYLVVRSPDNPDYWWGNFLLLARRPVPGTGDCWLARFAAEFPLARHVALGVDSDPDTRRRPQDDRPVPAEFLAAGLEPQRDTVLTCAAVGPPPHPNAAAEIRRLESDADWRQAVELSVRCFEQSEPDDYVETPDGGPAAGSPRRAAERGSAPLPAGGCSPSSGCSTRASGYARYQHVETDPQARRQGLAGTLVWHAGRYGREVLAGGHLRHRGRPGGCGHPRLPRLRVRRQPRASSASSGPRYQPLLGDHSRDELGRGDVEGVVERLGPGRGGRDA